jgi:hypothetical protein
LTTIFGIHIGIIGMAATWVDRSSSKGDAAKYEVLQHFILFHIVIISSVGKNKIEDSTILQSCREYKQRASRT